MKNRSEEILIKLAEGFMVKAKESNDLAQEKALMGLSYQSETYSKATDAYILCASLVLEKIKEVQDV